MSGPFARRVEQLVLGLLSIVESNLDDTVLVRPGTSARRVACHYGAILARPMEYELLEHEVVGLLPCDCTDRVLRGAWILRRIAHDRYEISGSSPLATADVPPEIPTESVQSARLAVAVPTSTV